MTDSGLRVVADVGGTNTRIAIYDRAADVFLHRVNYHNRDFNQFSDLLTQWQAGLGDLKPRQGCIAIAAPLVDDYITMVNRAWAFSREDITRHLRLEQLTWLNDFESNAHALPFLKPTQLESLHHSDNPLTGPLATIGPGTGLGGATVNSGQVQAGEPGHAGLSPANELELALFKELLRQYEDIYAELLLSGPGLLRIYQTLCVIRGVEPTALSPEEISNSALSGTDAICHEATRLFCDLLGSACGNFVLATGAYGGLYLAGGIVPAILPLIIQSQFLQRFRQKGAMVEQLERVSIYAINSDDTGIIGAAHAPLV
jgi:glucokinase